MSVTGRVVPEHWWCMEAGKVAVERAAAGEVVMEVASRGRVTTVAPWAARTVVVVQAVAAGTVERVGVQAVAPQVAARGAQRRGAAAGLAGRGRS